MQGHGRGVPQTGYDAKIIKMEGSRFELVTAESHDNFRRAVNRLNQFQDTVRLMPGSTLKGNYSNFLNMCLPVGPTETMVTEYLSVFQQIRHIA